MIGDILQPTHLIFIFVVALLVLGPKRLPEVGRSLGKGLRDFRGAMAGIEDQARDVFDPGESTEHSTEAAAPVVNTLPAPEPPTAPRPTAPVTESAAAASRVFPVAAPTAPRSGSGLAEPDPGDYAD